VSVEEKLINDIDLKDIAKFSLRDRYQYDVEVMEYICCLSFTDHV